MVTLAHKALCKLSALQAGVRARNDRMVCRTAVYDKFKIWTGICYPNMFEFPAMKSGYGEFCPIAKASEVFATRWTPLVLRELMLGAHSFNEIHRGVPLMSRTLLADRLRQLVENGVVVR